MGMFDWIEIDPSLLPDGGKWPDGYVSKCFQTKSLDNGMKTYKITAFGLEDPEPEKVVIFYDYYKGGCKEYKATFNQGCLIGKIELVKDKRDLS